MKVKIKGAMRLTAAVLAVSGMLMTGKAAMASSISGDVDVQNDTYVIYKEAVTKDSPTGTDAFLMIKTRIPAKDTLRVNILNKYDNVANKEPATFRNTGADTSKYIAYMDGKGKKGNPFRLKFSYDGIDTKKLTVGFWFIP